MAIGRADVTSGKTIKTDFCIIGAGPAGLIVAAELSAFGHEVVVLESGAAAEEMPAISPQELNEGTTHGDPYAGLRRTRHRGLGGTTLLWNSPAGNRPGAKYVPLDASDLDRRWNDSATGWPFRFGELEPWLRRAEDACGIASFAEEQKLLALTNAPAGVFSRGSVEPRVYQLASRDTLLNPLLTRLAAAPNVRLYTQSTAVDLEERHDGAAVHAADAEGERFAVQARRVVLACGAIENARLLMVSSASRSWPDDRSSWLGCGFMEHPRDRSITLRPRTPADYAALRFFDTSDVTFGNASHTILGRLGLSGDLLEREDLLNASATLLPNVQPLRERLREVMVRRTGVHGFRRWLPESGHGWSRHEAPANVFDGFTVLLNLEQPPRRENRVRLSEQRDRFGTALPQLAWHWHAEDDARLQRVRKVFCDALDYVGVGEVECRVTGRPDPNAHHHAGTTRMHADARQGVVDADARVHGTNALYVAGASVFPTAGFANPTLTIVAMAYRLANHLNEVAKVSFKDT